MGRRLLSQRIGLRSDSLAAKTTARLNAEGTHWVLNGEKMWISNGAFADVYTVFAKVDGEKFTGFIVERNDPGVSPGAEEHKMGQRGSSTTPLLLQDCAGSRRIGCSARSAGAIIIAFNILNFGRFKLGAGAIGGCKRVLGLAARYAAERRQFGQPIASFGAIKYKLAEMVDAHLCRRVGRLSHSRTDRGSRKRRLTRTSRPKSSRRSRNTPSNARSSRSPARRSSTTAPMKACRSSEAMVSRAAIPSKPFIVIRGSIGSSKGRTRSTASHSGDAAQACDEGAVAAAGSRSEAAGRTSRRADFRGRGRFARWPLSEDGR